MTTATSPSAPTAGCRALEVRDDGGVAIPVRVLYPSRAPERLLQYGPYPLAVATDAAVEGDGLPLVVVSHGTGSSPWTLRGLAAHLARAGFAVALVTHPGNNRDDDHLAGTARILEDRPRQVRRVVDAAFADPVLGPRLSGAGVAVVGHSLGGYTALAVAGGRPTAFPRETPDGAARPVPVARDPRVRALVLLAPATPWFMAEGALAEVDVPILMRTGERDEITRPDFHGAIVLRGVRDPSRVDHRVVPGANHFAFQSPYPPAMVRPEFLPSQDAPGFDRAAYQPVLHAEVEAFLEATIGPGRTA